MHKDGRGGGASWACPVMALTEVPALAAPTGCHRCLEAFAPGGHRSVCLSHVPARGSIAETSFLALEAGFERLEDI